MRYSLRRTRDGAGDQGNMSKALWLEDGSLRTEQNARPRVGVAMRVGTIFARTFGDQDWWQTTLIEEILIDKPKHVRFRTVSKNGSVYDWTVD